MESAPSAKKKRNAEAAGLSTTDGPSGGAGRGASAPPPGLAGPAPGLGGSGAAAAAVGLSTLQPQLAGDARMYPTYGRGANAQPPPPPPYGRGVPPVPVNMHHRPPHMMPALNAAPIAPFAQDTQRAPPPSQPYGGGTVCYFCLLLYFFSSAIECVSQVMHSDNMDILKDTNFSFFLFVWIARTSPRLCDEHSLDLVDMAEADRRQVDNDMQLTNYLRHCERRSGMGGVVYYTN